MAVQQILMHFNPSTTFGVMNFQLVELFSGSPGSLVCNGLKGSNNNTEVCLPMEYKFYPKLQHRIIPFAGCFHHGQGCQKKNFSVVYKKI